MFIGLFYSSWMEKEIYIFFFFYIFLSYEWELIFQRNDHSFV